MLRRVNCGDDARHMDTGLEDGAIAAIATATAPLRHDYVISGEEQNRRGRFGKIDYKSIALRRLNFAQRSASRGSFPAGLCPEIWVQVSNSNAAMVQCRRWAKGEFLRMEKGSTVALPLRSLDDKLLGNVGQIISRFVRLLKLAALSHHINSRLPAIRMDVVVPFVERHCLSQLWIEARE
jgi:hypothetical protein